MTIFKLIVPLYSISFKVDNSGVHHGILRCLVMTKVTFGTRNPSQRAATCGQVTYKGGYSRPGPLRSGRLRPGYLQWWSAVTRATSKDNQGMAACGKPTRDDCPR
ncbi:hypothetical protein GW17_00044107 [Ensete ventricosum]|nr:hypothetical protein GW17_00044107 [Ensete ventricosum]